MFSVREYLPLEQGLRLVLHSVSLNDCHSQRVSSIRTRIKTATNHLVILPSSVREYLPLEQGLRPTEALMTEIERVSQRVSSIRTRIKTPMKTPKNVTVNSQRVSSIRTRIKTEWTTPLHRCVDVKSESIFH